MSQCQSLGTLCTIWKANANACVQTQSPFPQHQFASISHTHQAKASRLFVLLLRRTLDLCCTSESLLSVLALLALLSAGLVDLCGHSNTNQSVVGLKLLQRLWRIVHERESGRLSTTILRLQTENVDLVLVGLVHFGELASEFILGDVGTVGVEDIDDHLLAAEEGVANKLACSQGNGLFSVRHLCERKNRSIRKSACDGIIETDVEKWVSMRSLSIEDLRKVVSFSSISNALNR